MKAEDPRDFISCSCNFVPTFVAFVLVFFPDLALAFVGAFDVDGGEVGLFDGDLVGAFDGGEVGLFDGDLVGAFDGGEVGLFDGDLVGAFDGGEVGLFDGDLVGAFDGGKESPGHSEFESMTFQHSPAPPNELQIGPVPRLSDGLLNIPVHANALRSAGPSSR